ncbi:MAG TPA: NADH:flavin oxidoreductase/NADH oxidase [Tepidisphaeraceae bacterium]|jgi:2,4-dienoyl-CoA reductase-like NADH-dependent reductase (Old Yellow Enzyme family)
MSHLLSPFTLRGVTLKNRIGLSPMCTFSARNGHVTDFHRAHYAARACGVGLAMVEATAVEARGVIAPDDLGIWSDAHGAGLTDLAARIEAAGAVPGIQLAHAGRKAGSYPVDDEGHTAIDVVGPSAIAFDAKRPVPREMNATELTVVCDAFVTAARRAVAAGFCVIELHMAHGYLLSSFLSPIPNQRSDEHGGDVIARSRFPLRVIDAVRAAVPIDLPLLVRVSAIDPEPRGQTIEDTITFARMAHDHGIDLIDCSAGGQTPRGWLKAKPGYQVKFADAVRHGANVPTAAVGVITDAHQAEAIVAAGRADLVLIGRALLENPHWAAAAVATLSAGAGGE